jgi:hypothetical protein
MAKFKVGGAGCVIEDTRQGAMEGIGCVNSRKRSCAHRLLPVGEQVNVPSAPSTGEDSELQ